MLQQQHKQQFRAITILMLSGILDYVASNLKRAPMILCMIATEVFCKLSLLSFKANQLVKDMFLMGVHSLRTASAYDSGPKYLGEKKPCRP